MCVKCENLQPGSVIEVNEDGRCVACGATVPKRKKGWELDLGPFGSNGRINYNGQLVEGVTKAMVECEAGKPTKAILEIMDVTLKSLPQEVLVHANLNVRFDLAGGTYSIKQFREADLLAQKTPFTTEELLYASGILKEMGLDKPEDLEQCCKRAMEENVRPMDLAHQELALYKKLKGE